MDWWTEVSRTVSSFVDQHGLLAAFVFLLIEEAGVPVPVPGDFLMLILGVQAHQGKVNLWQAILVLEAATFLGATFLYAVSALGGRKLVYRYGRFIRLSPDRLDRAERWLARHGFLAVFLGRLVPGLRIVTAVACGVFAVRWWVYLPSMALGALSYILVYTLAGYLLGPQILEVFEHVHLPLGLLGSLVPLVVVLVWVLRARAALRAQPASAHPSDIGHRVRAGALAGALATIGCTLAMNVLLNVAGNAAFSIPGSLIEQTAERMARSLAREVDPLLLAMAAPAYVGVGALWGAMYGAWVATHDVDRGVFGSLAVPDWLGGMAFAVIPLAASLLVAMPLLGLGILGIGATGPVAAAGESIRVLVYGAILGVTYPVLLARRRVRMLADF